MTAGPVHQRPWRGHPRAERQYKASEWGARPLWGPIQSRLCETLRPVPAAAPRV